MESGGFNPAALYYTVSLTFSRTYCSNFADHCRSQGASLAFETDCLFDTNR